MTAKLMEAPTLSLHPSTPPRPELRRTWPREPVWEQHELWRGWAGPREHVNNAGLRNVKTVGENNKLLWRTNVLYQDPAPLNSKLSNYTPHLKKRPYLCARRGVRAPLAPAAAPLRVAVTSLLRSTLRQEPAGLTPKQVRSCPVRGPCVSLRYAHASFSHCARAA